MTDPNPDSILDSVKKALGFTPDYTAFDLDITMHINTVFGTLNQIGVGPVTGFMIDDNTTLWSDFSGQMVLLSPVKSYIYTKVRLVFDPPATSFTIDALNRVAEELEFRLNIIGEQINPPTKPKSTMTRRQEELALAADAVYEIEMGWLFGNS